VLQASFVSFGLNVILSQAAFAQHILPAPPPPKSGIFGSSSNMFAPKSTPSRDMQRPQQRKRHIAPVVPVPSNRHWPNIVIGIAQPKSV
jgi:hypothetical protein